ncbi:MAG: MarC family protein [Comamonas sp.]
MSLSFATLFAAFSKSFLLVAATMLPILNPVSASAVFLTLTEGASPAIRRRLATRIAINVTLLTIFFMLVGSYMLDVFGLSIDIVRVGGGLLVAYIGWNMINASSSEGTGEKLADAFTPETARRRAFYPLTFPLTYGPGSLAATITVGVSLIDRAPAVTVVNVIGATIGAIAVGVVILLCNRYADKVLKPLGETGTIVFLRISAFILLCLGIQIAWSGMANLVSDAIEHGVLEAFRQSGVRPR